MWGPQGGGRGSGVLAHYTPPSPPFFDSSDVPAAADTGSGRPGFFISFSHFLLLFSGVRLARLAISREKMRRLVHDNYRILFFCIGISFQYIAAGPRLRTRSPL